MTQHIHSIQNPRIKKAAQLRKRRGREKQQRILIDGQRPVEQAATSQLKIREVFGLADELIRYESIVKPLENSGAEILSLSPAAWSRVSYGDQSAGLIAVADAPDFPLEQLTLTPNGLLIVLEQIEKPGNIGAILRTASAAGAAAVIITDPATDLCNPNTIRSSVGSLFTTPVAVTTGTKARDWLIQHQFRILTARVDGDATYTKTDLTGRVAMVLGSEASGLSADWEGPDTLPVVIPMLGTNDSLNVSVAAALMLYESRRQRDTQPSMNQV
jgi:TrmH family RNA methyltransferase